MAKILIGLLLVLTASNSFQDRKKTDLEHDMLKGRVKTVQVSFATLLNKSGILQESDSEFLRSFKYDAKGMLSEKVFVEDRMKIKHLYSYDSKGDRMAAAISNDGSNHLSWFFKHDTAGNRIEEKEFDDGTNVSITAYKYDASGNRVEEIVKRRNMSLRKKVNGYDDKGNIKEMTEYMDSAVIKKESYAYEFDSTGNWIKRIASTQKSKSGKTLSEPVSVTYRIITYY